MPDTRLERGVALAALAGALAAAGWLVWRIVTASERTHAPEFIPLAVLLGAALYITWLLWALASVHYTLQEPLLTVRQTLRRHEVPLDIPFELHRWRRRWLWAGRLQRDLGVDTVAMCPPFWVGRNETVWVLCWSEAGQRKALVLRPAPDLLAILRQYSDQYLGRAG